MLCDVTVIAGQSIPLAKFDCETELHGFHFFCLHVVEFIYSYDAPPGGPSDHLSSAIY